MTGKMTTENAPFGTTNTPSVRMKIIGGKPVYVQEDYSFMNEPKPKENHAENIYFGYQKPSPNVHDFKRKKNTMHNPYPLIPPISPKDQSISYNNSVLKKDFKYNSQAIPDIKRTPSPKKDMGLFPTSVNENEQDLVPSLELSALGQSPPRSPNKVISPPVTWRHPIRDSNREAYIQESLDENPEPDLTQYLPKTGYLPPHAISLQRDHELFLRRKIREELKHFDSTRLKEVYLELATLDRHLTSYVSFQDLLFSLMKAKMTVSTTTLQVVAAMFLSPKDASQVNYEKILSFLAASIKDRPLDDIKKESVDPNIDFIEQLDQAMNGKPGTIHRELAQLIHLAQTQMLGTSKQLDMSHVWQVFREADREHRETLSKEQIKSLLHACQVPLQDSIIDKIMERCRKTNGQYSWEPFLQFLDRVQPSQTGLNIPRSRRPLEHAIHFPEPSDNWPKKDEDITPRHTDKQTHKHQQNVEEEFNEVIDQLPLSHPRKERIDDMYQAAEKEEKIYQLELQLKQLEQDYEATKNAAISTRTEPSMVKTGWFERFTKFAQALFRSDVNNAGVLPHQEVKWLAEQYNSMHNLAFSEKAISSSLLQATQGNNINIDSFLRSLNSLRPQ